MLDQAGTSTANKTDKMITKTTGYQSSDGMIHGSIAAAQKAELKLLFGKHSTIVKSEPESDHLADVLLKESDKLIDILTMTSKSKPRARKINGGTKTRAKKSTRHEAEQFSLPMEDSPKPAA